jgi:hypothetical protein
LTGGIKRIVARQLKAQLHDGGEIALLDAPVEWPFSRRHLLRASCATDGDHCFRVAIA